RMTLRHSAPAHGLLAGLAVLGALLAVAPASGAPRPFQTGTHVLRRILFDQGCRPLSGPTQLFHEPKDSVLVVIGNPGGALDGLPAGWLIDFVERGGAVLFASDQQVSSEEVEKELRHLAGVQIAGFKLEADPSESYLSQPFCPLVSPAQRRRMAAESSDSL